MIPPRMLGQIEREFIELGYKYGSIERIGGWLNETTGDFVRFDKEVEWLQDNGGLKGWKLKEDTWKEVRGGK